MLRRSQSAIGQALLCQAQEILKDISLTAQPKLCSDLLNISEAAQKEKIAELFLAKYGYDARPKQVEAVVNLINGRSVFLLAGTGFGKSRVPELVHLAYDKVYAPIILSINPLDALGDDQVGEKALVQLGAVNLTGDNCTSETCEAIIQGTFPFVYVSPEVALTSQVFDRMWRDRRFQARLVLNVVDEAHMVYTWGLVASGQAKRLASHVRVQDAGVFRPSYGDLARRFLSSTKIPLVLMSATCTPQAINAIIANLKLDSRDVCFIRAELTRPEIRFIRRAFKRPLKGSVRGLFTHHSSVPTETIPPTLLYSGTQNATLEVLKMIHTSRGQPTEAGNGHSEFACRYHANTGPNTKLDAVAAYVAGALAVLCCTLALGLGQNWKRVRRVVVVGRQDPCNFTQMSGRCGRDGRRGLGILLVEQNRTGGKNSIADFDTPMIQSDDDRMDALALTPVCLRVALAVDLRLGYIPLYVDDSAVTLERARQTSAGMALCDCSNCRPEEGEALWLAQPALTIDNFDAAMSMSEQALLQLVSDLPDPPPTPAPEVRPVAMLCGSDDAILDSPLHENLVTQLERAFHHVFYDTFPQSSDLGPADYFGRDLAWDIAKNIDILTKPSDLGVVLASETLAGEFQGLFNAFCEWKTLRHTAELIQPAAEQRKLGSRAYVPPKPPQSVEGMALCKARAEIANQALKDARVLEKEIAEQAKLALKEQRAQAKVEADKLKQAKAESDKLKKEAAKIEAAKLKKAKADSEKLKKEAAKVQATQIKQAAKAEAAKLKQATKDAAIRVRAQKRQRPNTGPSLEGQSLQIDAAEAPPMNHNTNQLKRAAEEALDTTDL